MINNYEIYPGAEPIKTFTSQFKTELCTKINNK